MPFLPDGDVHQRRCVSVLARPYSSLLSLAARCTRQQSLSHTAHTSDQSGGTSSVCCSLLSFYPSPVRLVTLATPSQSFPTARQRTCRSIVPMTARKESSCSLTVHPHPGTNVALSPHSPMTQTKGVLYRKPFRTSTPATSLRIISSLFSDSQRASSTTIELYFFRLPSSASLLLNLTTAFGAKFHQRMTQDYFGDSPLLDDIVSQLDAETLLPTERGLRFASSSTPFEMIVISFFNCPITRHTRICSKHKSPQIHINQCNFT